jgi:hypothetical protein
MQHQTRSPARGAPSALSGGAYADWTRRSRRRGANSWLQTSGGSPRQTSATRARFVEPSAQIVAAALLMAGTDAASLPTSAAMHARR